MNRIQCREYVYILKIISVSFTLFSSCRSAYKNETTENDSIFFAILNIHKHQTDERSSIELISKTQTSGNLKNKNEYHSAGENYLTIHVYSKKQLIDSMSVEHPLYKHIEYWTADNTFAVKDTILDQAEFFIRFQSSSDFNELRISETINNKTIKGQTILKLF